MPCDEPDQSPLTGPAKILSARENKDFAIGLLVPFPGSWRRVSCMTDKIAKVLLVLFIALVVQGCANRRSTLSADDERIRASTEDRRTWIDSDDSGRP